MDFARFFHYFKENRAWRALIMLINLGGIAYGFYYYLPQFMGSARLGVEAAPAYLWLFVPDSPLAVLWAELALVLYSFGRRSDVVDALAVVANVKVGLWTAFVLGYHAEHFDTWNLAGLNFYLLWLHLGMVALAFVFLHDLRGAGWRLVAGITAWLLVNDWMDYGFPGYGNHGCHGLRPYTVPCTDIGVTAAVTVGLSLLSVAFLAAFALQPRAPPSRGAGGRVAEAGEKARAPGR